MGRVLITGASGFVGRNLVEHLVSLGMQPIAWVRSVKSKNVFSSVDVDVQVGSLDQAAEYVSRQDGIEAIVHLAAVVSPYSRKETYRVNVQQSVALAKACRKRLSPPTFIYMSSLAASGPCIDGVPRVESDPCSPTSIYGQSKRACEKALAEVAQEVPISIARPPAIFGPWDHNLLQMFHMVKFGWNLIGVSSQFRYSFIHVEDLACGIVKMLNSGKRLVPPSNALSDEQGIYFLADPEQVSFIDLANKVASSLHLPNPWHITIPASICWCVAAMSEAKGRIQRVPTYLNLDKMREAVAGSWVCDPERAKQELDFCVEMDLSHRIDEVTTWYRSQNWL